MNYLASNANDHSAVHAQAALSCKKGVLLIDDDEWFRSLFRVICEAQGVPVSTFASLADMPSFASLRDYDVVILDYYLESFKGSEIAEYVDVFFSHLPVIVISSADIAEREQKAWPTCIRRFMNKTSGPHAILDCALGLVSQQWPVAKAANLN